MDFITDNLIWVSVIFVVAAILLAVGVIYRKKISSFISKTVLELKRVSWIDTKTAVNLTVSVIVVSAFFALVITLYELMLQEVFTILIDLVEQ
jgi:preprotein translocase SecE subunit